MNPAAESSHAPRLKERRISNLILEWLTRYDAQRGRLLVSDLLEMAVSNELHPLVRKRLTEMTQLLQVYARLAELEIDAGERPRGDEVALSEDTGERVRRWAEGEEAKVR